MVSRIGKLARDQLQDDPALDSASHTDVFAVLKPLLVAAQKRLVAEGYGDYLERYLAVIASGRFPLGGVLFTHHLDCVDMFTCTEMAAVRCDCLDYTVHGTLTAS